MFDSLPPINVVVDGDRGPEVPVLSAPSRDYGVGLSRVRLGGATFMSGTPVGQHVIWIQHSASVPVVTRLAGRRIEHEPGPRSICINPDGCDNTCEIGGPSDAMLIRVSAECLAVAAAQLGAYGRTLVAMPNRRDDALYQVARILEAEAARGHPGGALFWSVVTDVFIRNLVAHHHGEPVITKWGKLDARTLARLDAFIHEHIGQPLDLDTLAAVAECDRFYFARRFRQATGVSPHRYVVRCRLDHARALMRAGKTSLAEIAAAAGFADQSHMNNWIRKVFSTTPTQLIPSI